MNNITCTILPNGSIRIDTDKISGPAHASAEAALQWYAKEMGGDVSRNRLNLTHTHVHDHDHEHDHSHE